jgi:hypothetical protein
MDPRPNENSRSNVPLVCGLPPELNHFAHLFVFGFRYLPSDASRISISAPVAARCGKWGPIASLQMTLDLPGKWREALERMAKLRSTRRTAVESRSHTRRLMPPHCMLMRWVYPGWLMGAGARSALWRHKTSCG